VTIDPESDFIGSPPSPCVRNCCLDADDVCMGCHRSLPEICAWHGAPDAEKLEILLRCRERYKQRYEKTRRG
jgi:predicted Fe-S protein YdhL (DUF1289 family)